MKKILLGIEFAVLFFGIPLLMFLDTGFNLPSVLLIPILIIILLILRFKTEFKWKELVILRIKKKTLIKDGLIILACAACLFVSLMILFPGKLFNLPRTNPLIWLALGAFYPVFSAFPQEVLFRTYIFKRYRKVFTKNWQMIAASGVSFSFVHILYYHPLSLILTFVGGVYLASAYKRTQSVLYTSVLHGILGMLVFTLGFGEFFWLEMYKYL
ncbi:lysostaphin resistance A-like protein [Bacteroidota bacterium]